MQDETTTGGRKVGRRFLGSLRDALAAAGNDELKSEERRKMEAKAQSKAATTVTVAPAIAQEAAKGVPLKPATSATPPAPTPDAPPQSAEALAATSQAATSQSHEGTPPKLEEIAAPPALPVASKASSEVAQTPPALPASDAPLAQAEAGATQTRQSAAEAARQARGESLAAEAPKAAGADASPSGKDASIDDNDDPTTRYNRPMKAAAKGGNAGADQTQFVRGKAKVSRADFHQDPVVGWLVIVGGPGLGSFRPVFEGNNTLGRGASQRIPLDFGDETISSEEQAYIRYDSVDRTFLFVPNLAKTNVVQVNNQKPTGAVALSGMDVITMGRTQLVFVPFCGADFDWSELSNLKE